MLRTGGGLPPRSNYSLRNATPGERPGLQVGSGFGSSAEGGKGAFELLQLGKRQQKRQRRLGALVLVNSIGVQAVMAAAGAGVVEFHAEIVAAEEPFEGEPRFIEPCRVFGRAIGFDAGGDSSPGLDWLLIEIGPRAAARVKAVAADGAEVTARGALDADEPLERCSPNSCTAASPLARPLRISACDSAALS